MDEGYLAQNYYTSMLKLTTGKEETYDSSTYSWIEHICRKIGQWSPDPTPMKKNKEAQGFDLYKANP